MSAIDDHARLFPGGDEVASGGRPVELHHQIIKGGDHVHQSGHARLEVADERGAVGDRAPGRVEQAGEARDGGAEGGDARGVHAASGGTGLRAGGLRQVADERGGADEGLVAEFLDVAFAEINLGEVRQVAGLAVMRDAGAGQDVGGVFQRGLRGGLGVRGAGRGGVSQCRGGTDGLVFAAHRRKVRAEVERRLPVPDGVVFGFVSDGQAGADHVELVGDAIFHTRCFRF